MKRRRKKHPGIFCIEGEGYNDLPKPTSFEGVLALLKTLQSLGYPLHPP